MINLRGLITDSAKWILPLFIYFIVLFIKVPASFSKHFFISSATLFLFFLLIFYGIFRLDRKYLFIGFALILLLFALSLSYKWTSGYSDTRIIGGLLPYKDGKSYYDGAIRLLNGKQLNAGRSTWRPLFPAFLSSLLWLTGQNLLITNAIFGGLVATGIYLSAVELSRAWGALSASLYTVFLYFYIQYFIGVTASEIMGLLLGCFAFLVLFRTASDPKWLDVGIGLITLMLAVSARAGAYFVFPLLVLWVGWIFRGTRRFSVKAALMAFLVIALTFILSSTVLRVLIGAETGSSFGNFSYVLYGQVRGGTGWHSAIDILGTRDSTKVYEAAIQYFLQHPFSFFLAAIKSYRDFFLPGSVGIFVFSTYGDQALLGYVLWLAGLGLLLFGLFKLIKSDQPNVSSLLISCFVGLMLSIPFLPPIDGGPRFYASTMPFFFALVSIGIGSHTRSSFSPTFYKESISSGHIVARSLSVLFLVLAIPIPILNRYIQNTPEKILSECLPDERSFTINNVESYINIVKNESQCGLLPNICFDDFSKNGAEKGIDDFFDQLHSLAESSINGIRIVPAHNLHDWQSYYFVQNLEHSSFNLEDKMIAGCGVKIQTKNQRIFQISSSALPK